jgi:hypothetical protein
VIARRRHRFNVVGPLALLCLVWPTRLVAQTSLQIPLQFDFINPGAKSLALAGSFAGLADDATAAFANPSGLTLLDGSELSIELRGTRIDTAFLQSGRLSGVIINQGVDTVQGPVFGESVGSDFGVGYFSGLYMHPSRRWVIAGYRHELARVDQTFSTEGVFQQDPTEFTSRRDSPQDGSRKVSITGWGASGAYTLGTGVTVGAGLVVYTFDMNSIFRRFDISGFLGPPNRNVEFGRSTQIGSDLGVAPTFGLTIDHRQTRVGVVYRQGPTFEFTTESGIDPIRTGTFRVPNTFGVGASHRLTSQFLVAGEVTYITYSRLVNDFVTDQAHALGRQASFSVDDGTEFHVGIQYALRLSRGAPLRLRGGTWYDPDHSVHFTLDPASATPRDRLFDELMSMALSTGKSQFHGTGGVGLTLHRRVELNVGFDLASTTRYFSTSFIVHLGKETAP